MNIAYYCPDRGIPVFGDKGASVHVRETLAAMQREGHEVTLLASRLGNGNPAPCARYFDLSEAFAQPAPRTRLNRIASGEADKLAADRRLADLAIHALEQAHIVPDAVYERYALFHRSGLEIARRLNVPYILEVNSRLIDEQAIYRGLCSHAAAWAIERELFESADALVAVSQEVAAYARANAARAKCVTVLPNGVDIARFAGQNGSGALRMRYGLEDRPVVGFFGSLKHWHGVDLLLDAFEAVWQRRPDAQLLIAGEGPESENLARKVAGSPHKSRVTMTGALPYAEIPKHLSLMAFSVAPYRRSENFYFSPLKILESLAAARPVVAPRLGQIPELVQHGGTGLLYEPDDVRALSAAILHLLERPKLCVEMGLRGSAFIRDGHTWDHNAREIAAIVRRVISAKPAERMRA